MRNWFTHECRINNNNILLINVMFVFFDVSGLTNLLLHLSTSACVLRIKQ